MTFAEVTISQAMFTTKINKGCVLYQKLHFLSLRFHVNFHNNSFGMAWPTQVELAWSTPETWVFFVHIDAFFFTFHITPDSTMHTPRPGWERVWTFFHFFKVMPFMTFYSFSRSLEFFHRQQLSYDSLPFNFARSTFTIWDVNFCFQK